ncbi:hypothetical protein OLX02_18555 [Novosphingobium sp. KCTC 2891]|uniref:TorF family putative porin n=1 Tax=Novosphingobium sp. KCTC 2891 TaxID=2989730 RepID=UPI002221CF58|nr:TorF family putative porin [Novosphingobium sp. KCTC 2891]MCW1384822.1 hypothetical protein [Novosphingobium sp. KCTC 2891]
MNRMNWTKAGPLVALAGCALAGAPAHAGVVPTGGIEAATDEVRRGISWSGGDPVASADVQAEVAGFDASARVVTTRGADRHAGADAVADLELGKSFDAGALTLRGAVTGHVFAGAERKMDYVELGLGARYGLGPLDMGVGAIFAPSQSAIGGDNLYLYTNARVGLPAFPISLTAAAGYTTGGSDGSLRAARLRPGGDYADWRVGLEYSQFPFTVGVDYAGNDISKARALASGSPYADAAHIGDRVVARLRFGF